MSAPDDAVGRLRDDHAPPVAPRGRPSTGHAEGAGRRRAATLRVTLTLLRFRARDSLFPLRQVATLHRERPVAGARFLELMGTGRGRGFSAVPSITTWVLLGAFESPDHAARFHAGSRWLAALEARAAERYRLSLAPLHSHGRWDGQQPFGAFSGSPPAHEGPLLVVTRARIRLAALPAFWREVPAVDADLARSEVAVSVGFGEIAWIHQATCSLWPNAAAMRRFVLGSHHREVMRRARSERWLAEDLFARFRPLASDGTWGGRDPLRELRDRAA